MADGAGTKDFRDAAQRVPTSPARCVANGDGREPLRRVRDFGSDAAQAMKKVRRPDGGERQNVLAARHSARCSTGAGGMGACGIKCLIVRKQDALLGESQSPVG